jgi:hypothetical protein
VVYQSSLSEGARWRGERRSRGVNIGSPRPRLRRKTGPSSATASVASTRHCELRMPAMTQSHVEGAHARGYVGNEDGNDSLQPRAGKRRGLAATAAAPLGTSTLRLNHSNTSRLFACQRDSGRRSFLIDRILLSLRVPATHNTPDRRDVTPQDPRRHTTDLTCTAIVALPDRAHKLRDVPLSIPR